MRLNMNKALASRIHLFLKYPLTNLFVFPAQNYVGSVICQCDDEGAESETDDENMVEDGTVFGITSVLKCELLSGITLPERDW